MKVYINKGIPKSKEWVGAAIFHDDGKLELLGGFVPLVGDEELPEIKKMWEESPRDQMQIGWMQDEPDEIIEDLDASPALVEEARKGKFSKYAANARVMI